MTCMVAYVTHTFNTLHCYFFNPFYLKMWSGFYCIVFLFLVPIELSVVEKALLLGTLVLTVWHNSDFFRSYNCFILFDGGKHILILFSKARRIPDIGAWAAFMRRFFPVRQGLSKGSNFRFIHDKVQCNFLSTMLKLAKYRKYDSVPEAWFPYNRKKPYWIAMDCKDRKQSQNFLSLFTNLHLIILYRNKQQNFLEHFIRNKIYHKKEVIFVFWSQRIARSHKTLWKDFNFLILNELQKNL